ncbi:MAG TPA: hypothetical protein VF064_16280 [Pyrinomonadaceae bacterium]
MDRGLRIEEAKKIDEAATIDEGIAVVNHRLTSVVAFSADPQSAIHNPVALSPGVP